MQLEQNSKITSEKEYTKKQKRLTWVCPDTLATSLHETFILFQTKIYDFLRPHFKPVPKVPHILLPAGPSVHHIRYQASPRRVK